MTILFKIQQYTTEQKIRLIYLIIIFIFNFQILYFFKFELLYLIINKLNYLYFIFTNIFDFFLTLCIIVFFFTLILTINFGLIQYYIFKKTMLKKNQQKILYYKILFLYFYNFCLLKLLTSTLIPYIWNFFLTFEIYNKNLIIELIPNIKNYIFFFIQWFYIIYILQILIYILYFFIFKRQYLTIPKYLYTRTICYPILILSCAILTPPDIFSLLFLIIPIYIYLEIFLYLNILLNNLRKIGFEPTM